MAIDDAAGCLPTALPNVFLAGPLAAAIAVAALEWPTSLAPSWPPEGPLDALPLQTTAPPDLAWLAASAPGPEPGPAGEPPGGGSPHRLTEESLRSLRAELKPPLLVGRLGTLLLS